MSGNSLLAGDSTTGNGGDAGSATSGNSVGGKGGNAQAQGGDGGGGGVDVLFFVDGSGNLDMSGGTTTVANGANAATTSAATSTGGGSGLAPGGDITTQLAAEADTAANTGSVDNDGTSGAAASGNAQNNVPLVTGLATGADATGNMVTAEGMSLGGTADGGLAWALSQGGMSEALNDADGTSHALVLGYADAGHGGNGGVASVDIGQQVDPIVIAPYIELPYSQSNESNILDGNEFQGLEAFQVAV